MNVNARINGVKVFAATMYEDRARLGETVTRWLEAKRQNPEFELLDYSVTQSSDSGFHCLSHVIFYYEPIVIPTGGKKLFR